MGGLHKYRFYGLCSLTGSYVTYKGLRGRLSIGCEANSCISWWLLGKIWYDTGYSYQHYSGLHGIFVLNNILSATFKEGASHTKTQKNQTENIGSLNSSFTALTRQDVSSHYSVGRERLASAGSLDISSPFSICGHQCSFNCKTFSIIQCLWEVSSDTLCSLVTSLLAALFQKLSFLWEATSFLSRRV